MALAPGDAVPAFRVKEADGADIAGEELWSDGIAVLLFYVFDWSGEDGG
jgi:hypothetical protein